MSRAAGATSTPGMGGKKSRWVRSLTSSLIRVMPMGPPKSLIQLIEVKEDLTLTQEIRRTETGQPAALWVE